MDSRIRPQLMSWRDEAQEKLKARSELRPIVGSHCGLPITLLRGPNYHCFTDNASLHVTGITEEWSTETQKSPQRNAPVCQDLISPAATYHQETKTQFAHSANRCL